MVDPTHARLSIVRQCRVVSIARSSFYYAGQGENPLNLRLMRLIDEQFLETPFYGSRQMTRWLRRQGDTVSRKRVRRLMRLLGVHALFQRPRTSQPHPAHRIYPYLLRDLRITRPNHVWCTDVTYIPLQWGFLYLVAVMDWASRKVLSWRLSNTLDASFCVEALHEALERYGPPEIFNSDQGSQFTSVDFTDVLKEAGIRISMDGKGRWMPWCTTRDLGQSLPSTPRSEVPHDEFQAHPAEVRPEGLPCPELAGVRDGSPRSRESDRRARTHRWQARQLELAEADAQEARPTTPVLEPRHRDDGHLGLGVWPGVQAA